MPGNFFGFKYFSNNGFKSVYYDVITIIQEVNESGVDYPTYFINMKDEKAWKIMKVANGEMTVYKYFLIGKL